MGLAPVMAGGGILISFLILGISLSVTDQNNDHIHNQGPNPIQLSYVEDTLDLVREADARVLPQFTINNDFVDPDDNCDFCTLLNYTPGLDRKAAIAYKIYPANISESKRVVFFAKGTTGGEKMAFVAAGIERTGEDDNENDNHYPQVSGKENIFGGLWFPIVTRNITLSESWQRYEISLAGFDLNDVKYPFGFILFGDNFPRSFSTSTSSSIFSSSYHSPNQIVYIKGVTFDNRTATNSLEIL